MCFVLFFLLAQGFQTTTGFITQRQDPDNSAQVPGQCFSKNRSVATVQWIFFMGQNFTWNHGVACGLVSLVEVGWLAGALTETGYTKKESGPLKFGNYLRGMTIVAVTCYTKLSVDSCTWIRIINFHRFNFTMKNTEITPPLKIPYLLDQTPLSISRHSQIVATPPDVLSEIVAALEY